MSWKPGLMPVLDVVLRVPPLFIMDSILNGTFLLPWLSTKPGIELLQEGIETNDVYSRVTVLLSFICFIISILIFLLTTKQILEFYSYIFSGVVLWFSYWFNKNYISSELQRYDSYEEPLVIFRENPGPTVSNVFVQVAMAFCYNSFHIDVQQRSDYVPTGKDTLMEVFRSLTYMCLLQPVIWRFLLLSPDWLRVLPYICVLLVSMELVFIAGMQLRHLYNRTKLTISTIRVLVRTYGFQFFIESQWVRLHVPNVLRVFWITRTVYHVINLTIGVAYENLEANETFTLNNTEVGDISRQALISGSETVLALLGMTSMISYITHYFGVAMATFVGSENEEDKTMGTVSAILFFILAQQTGLTGLHPDKRLQRLFRNFCLLSTAILHFIHSMVNPLLMNLSAGHNSNRWRHARPLFMCFLLISLPITLMFHLWENNTLSTWMLAVTAFSIEVIIKVVITLMLYGLFMYDTYRDPFWEKMDDYIYYIKSTGNTIEFLFGILLFGNGAWIMIFEHGGSIRACMMCIHAYFNIWVQAKQGWKVFINRRTAVKKIESLPNATQQQLEEHNDVCAICYQDLNSARMTRCNHLFHGVCLRKWLYLQDRCPLCHQLIYKPTEGEDNSETARNQQNNNNHAGAANAVDQNGQDNAAGNAGDRDNLQNFNNLNNFGGPVHQNQDAAAHNPANLEYAAGFYDQLGQAAAVLQNDTDASNFQVFQDPYGPHGGTSSNINLNSESHIPNSGINASQHQSNSHDSFTTILRANLSPSMHLTPNQSANLRPLVNNTRFMFRNHNLDGPIPQMDARLRPQLDEFRPQMGPQNSGSATVPNGDRAHLHHE